MCSWGCCTGNCPDLWGLLCFSGGFGKDSPTLRGLCSPFLKCLAQLICPGWDRRILDNTKHNKTKTLSESFRWWDRTNRDHFQTGKWFTLFREWLGCTRQDPHGNPCF